MDFEELNKTTQKARGFVQSFYEHKNWTLYDVYNKPSSRKVSIFNQIKNELENQGFYNISCISGGTGYFSMGAENVTHIVYITYAHNYIIEK